MMLLLFLLLPLHVFMLIPAICSFACMHAGHGNQPSEPFIPSRLTSMTFALQPTPVSISMGLGLRIWARLLDGLAAAEACYLARRTRLVLWGFAC